MKKKKGFTLIELLVVISIIAMLLAILMPALGKVKRLAQRLVCGTNVKGLGNACYVYANDYDDDFPRAGGLDAVWTDTTDLSKNPPEVTVAASLYLLVREADVGTGSFICNSGDETQFEPDADPTDLFDFGDPQEQQSYAYQSPYKVDDKNCKTAYPASPTSNSSNAVIADKNPWMDDNMIQGEGSEDSFEDNVYAITLSDHDSSYEIQRGNSGYHDREGQNVLFVDGHVSFEKRPDCGTRFDNIYTQRYHDDGGFEGEKARRIGTGKPDVGAGFPTRSTDSFLVNDESSRTE